jgi:hypothetical protein
MSMIHVQSLDVYMKLYVDQTLAYFILHNMLC